jgi:hypothetical protein
LIFLGEAMNQKEIERIAAEAALDEVPEIVPGQDTGPGQQGARVTDAAEAFAEFLDMGAGIVGTALALETVQQRFNHGANVQIARAAVNLCEKYGLDPYRTLLGGDSKLSAWLGLAVAIGLPGFAVYRDYQAKNAEEVKPEGAGGDSQQQGE